MQRDKSIKLYIIYHLPRLIGLEGFRLHKSLAPGQGMGCILSQGGDIIQTLGEESLYFNPGYFNLFFLENSGLQY